MIDLYTWTTPNGRKVSIMLEELGVPYAAHAVNIGQDEQFDPAFLKIAPNNKIPAIVDREAGVELMESAAIMFYLAEKHGKFLDVGEGRYRVMEWLMWQMGGVGPILGQVHHFVKYNSGKAPYAEERFATEARRLYGVLDRRLAESEFVGCGEYSIADIATMPWLRSHERQGVAMDEYPNVKRWFDWMNARPAVQRGVQVLADRRKPQMSDKDKETLFGKPQ